MYYIIQISIKVWTVPSDGHDELLAVPRLVDGSHGPGDADSEEDVDGVTSRHVADRSVGVLILSGGHFAGEHI